MEGHDAEAPVMSPLEQWAAQVHELYTAMLKAGFKAEEALALIAGMSQQADFD
jgi:hypothetical protein